MSALDAEPAPALPPTMRAVVAAAGRCALDVAHAVPAPRAGEVLVRVAYSAINRADTMQRRGRYPPPPGVTAVLGLEAAGTVVQLGEGAAGRVGDRVMALLAGGGNAEFVCVPAAHLLPVPAKMSLRTAAAIPETFLTAFQLLHTVGHARAGETVLVHAAGSGVGTAAVQLAVLAELRVVAVAGSDAKLATAARLGAAHLVNYKALAAAPGADAQAWSKAVLGATDGKGCELVLDPVGGSFWRGNAEAVALDGRWVLYGSLGGVDVEGPLLGLLMRKRAALLATTLRTRTDAYKAALVAAFAEAALPALVDGRIVPVIAAEFELADAQAAHELMESDVTCGKVLLRVAGEA